MMKFKMKIMIIMMIQSEPDAVSSLTLKSKFDIDFDFDEENNDEKKDGGGDSSLKNPSGRSCILILYFVFCILYLYLVFWWRLLFEESIRRDLVSEPAHDPQIDTGMSRNTKAALAGSAGEETHLLGQKTHR